MVCKLQHNDFYGHPCLSLAEMSTHTSSSLCDSCKSFFPFLLLLHFPPLLSSSPEFFLTTTLNEEGNVSSLASSLAFLPVQLTNQLQRTHIYALYRSMYKGNKKYSTRTTVGYSRAVSWLHLFIAIHFSVIFFPLKKPFLATAKCV